MKEDSKEVFEMSQDELDSWMRKNKVTGYDILKMPGCPITLPQARSMTQARMDYYHNLPRLITWYNTHNQ